MKAWRKDPILFVRDNFKIDPDLWQIDALMAAANPDIQRISLQACVGPGKTAVLAWIGLWFLSCFCGKGEHPKGAAVSITGDNLKDNLWPEFSKWIARSPFLEAMFTWTKERIFSKEHPSTWFLSARSWSKTANAEEQGRTLSGLHSQFVLILLDESGEIPTSVLKAGEQALSNCKFGKIVQAGNPTSHEGILYAAATHLRNQWHVINITSDPDDPKRSPRIDIEWAREQIRSFGRDNPWVMSSILGIFPPTSINSLLSPEEVEAAMHRRPKPEDYEFSQKRLGVDVARQGMDSSIIFQRQGLMSFKPIEMRNLRSNEVAARVMQVKSEWSSEMEFIDGTGGYGAGVVDSLIQAGQSPQEIHFSSKALDPRYFNKRSEMIFLMAEWIKRGGSLPLMPELIKELTSPTYTFKNGKFAVEEKEQIRARLGFSCDKLDALALTFALPEMPASFSLPGMMMRNLDYTKHEYDPFAEANRTLLE